LSLNEIFAFKHFLTKNLVRNFDCRLEGENIQPSTLNNISADYFLNTQIANIENADACLLVGVNIRQDAPLLNVRLRSAFAKKPKNIAKMAVIKTTISVCINYFLMGKYKSFNFILYYILSKTIKLLIFSLKNIFFEKN
jgi:NADH-quinone oxidoreductase subunit G